MFLAALGPGYVYIRVAERRHPRADRSGLLEAVELIVIGACASTAALLATVLTADAFSVLSTSRFATDPAAYFRGHTLPVIGLAAVVLVVAYVFAYGLASIVHRKQTASVRPEGTSWYDAFWENRPTANDVVVVTIELRDHRKITGKLRSFTTGLEDSREIGLAAPIAVKASPSSTAQTIDDRFIVVREADVLTVSGRYVPGPPLTPARARRLKRFRPRKMGRTLGSGR